MAGDSSGDRTEKPTPKRLKEGRKKGQVARSPDVIAWAGILVVSFIIPRLVDTCGTALSGLLEQLPEFAQTQDLGTIFAAVGTALSAIVFSMFSLFAVVTVIGVVGGVAQGGARPYMTRIKPDFKRWNPMSAAKRVFGPQGAWELTKQLLKTSVVGLVAYRAFEQLVPIVNAAGAMPLDSLTHVLGDSIIRLIRAVAVTALILAAIDFGVSWRRVRKQLMMSKRDIKDEHKQSEGDPFLKGAIRQRAMAISRNRMMALVSEADVVLVNPTHVAVALKYVPGQGAPRVIAKGKGAIAARIRALAVEHRVPMVEDVPLARALHAVELGYEIPAEFYTAVARVLAFVMSLKARGMASGLHTKGEMASMNAIAVS